MQQVTVTKGKANRVFKDRDSLYLSTPSYDSHFIAIMKAFPVRYYDPVNKSWEVPLSHLDKVKSLFPTGLYRGLDEVFEKMTLLEDDVDKYLEYLKTLKIEAPYQPRTEMRPWQVEFFNVMLNNDQFILADPQGMGKTKEGIDAAEYRRQAFGYQKVIFACKDKHKLNMAKEIKKHGRSKYVVVTGLKRARERKIQEFFDDPEAYYLIIGYESGKVFQEQILLEARKTGIDGILCDEFTKIINPDAQLTKAWMSIIKKTNPEMLLFMSGTPIPKRPLAAWVPLYLTKTYKRDYKKFKYEFCHVDEWGRYNGPKNVEELHRVLKSVMIRRPKGLLKLRPKIPVNFPIEMGVEQANLYHAVVLNLREELKDTILRGGVANLAKLTRLRQVTTNPALVESEAPSAKHEALLDLLEEIVDDQGEYAIITSVYKEETRYLRRLLAHYNPCYIDGDTKDTDAQDEVDKFQDSPHHKVFIGTNGSIKESYTLTKAKFVIFIDLSWTWSDNEQLEDRAWRLGQDGEVTIYRFIIENTIDDHVMGILETDAKLIDLLMEGRVSPQTQQNFIRKVLEIQ